jgi:hypothetical protein
MENSCLAAILILSTILFYFAPFNLIDFKRELLSSITILRCKRKIK